MITKGEEILLVGLQEITKKLDNSSPDPRLVIEEAGALVDATLNMFEKEGTGKPAVQFNPGVYGEKRPLDWHEEGFKGFHPAVRGTSYMEVNELIGTSGCSPEEPYWTWTVCGVIETKRGKLLVCPNDWILELVEGHFIVLPDSVYRSSKRSQ